MSISSHSDLPPPNAQSQTHETNLAFLAVAAREGDRHAFDQLVTLFQRQLFGLSLMMVRDPGGAEEVTQDAFVRAFIQLDCYDERRPFYPWIATIAVRLAQTWLRKHGRENVPGSCKLLALKLENVPGG